MSGSRSTRFPLHGWLGLALVAVFWPLNWMLPGLRTHWAFFPLWLGYALAVDGINVRRTGTSLLTRGPLLYAGLFVVSVPLWWIFEAINRRTANWVYVGAEHFSDLEYALLASLSFSTVVPAVLGTAEAFAGTRWVRHLPPGPLVGGRSSTSLILAGCGAVMFTLMLTWPRHFFPCVWLSLFLMLEPLNSALGNRSLLEWTRRGDWRPVVSLCVGALVCGFFWELWNVGSFPKWEYRIPFFGFWHVFEMPLLGYGGYLPFALEVFAMVHFALGLVGLGRTDYVVAGLALEADPANGARSAARAGAFARRNP